MAGPSKLQSGADYLPKYNWTPGMNDEVAYADRSGYGSSPDMATSGMPAEWTDFGALEVGPSAYEMDPMGEDRSMMTFVDGGSKAMGHIGMEGAEGSTGMQPTQALKGGKSANLSDPQTYNNIAGVKRK